MLFDDDNPCADIDWKKNDSKSVTDMPEATAALLKAMGAATCKTTSAAAGGISIIPPFAVGGAVATSIGCEQLHLLVSKVQTFQQIVTCVLHRASQSSSARIIATNDVTITGPLVGKLTINQDIHSTVQVMTQLTANDQLEITSHVDSFVKEFAEALQSSKTELVSNPQGQKDVEALSNQITQSEVQTQIVENIQKVSLDFIAGNKITINLTGYDGITADKTNVKNNEIVINQDIVINYAAQLYLDAALNAIFDLQEAQQLVEDIKAEQKNESKGLSDLVSKLTFGGILIFVVIAAAFVLFGGGVIQNIFKYLIPILIVATVVVAVIFGIKKNYLVMGVAIGGTAVLSGLEVYTVTHKK